ncbi:hematopoietic prostaglandin D synthase-like [Bombus bifarius]|uniref:glutathione transferase n=1 Tax=Bombus bifarius TaxID=103933 RepID=A0A6P8N8K7_9HYME|nr:hematopoietic prostaglandin D synthase-like [Bombus bifarius]
MSHQHTYKLISFNARGSAEHIRYIFAYTGIEYTEERIPEELWPQYKDSMPYKKLPVLEVDGKPVAEADDVARYLARMYDLMGRNERDALICDELVETLGDLKQAICYYRMEEDPEKKEARKNQLLNETIPLYLTKFDQIIGENGGYIIPSITTWADFVFSAAVEDIEYMFGALDIYPALQALQKRIHRIPAISDWLGDHPTNYKGCPACQTLYTNRYPKLRAKEDVQIIRNNDRPKAV